jgi:hypothetical protein
MLRTYSSITNDESCGRKKKKAISQLARDSFDAFKPFINLYDCGLKGCDGPFHLIPKKILAALPTTQGWRGESGS